MTPDPVPRTIAPTSSITAKATRESKQIRSVTIPADVVPYFEAAIHRRGIAAGVTYDDDDGSRTLHVDADAWDEQAVVAAAEEGVEELKATLASRGVPA